MIVDPTGTTTFPNFTDPMDVYTLDEAYDEAQSNLWSTFFGDLLAWALFACLTIQVYFYFINFSQDRRLIKVTVLTLFLLEIADTSFLTWTGYVTHVKHWGHSVQFMPGVWGAMLFDCSIASIVHALYSWRIFKLITRRWLAILLTSLIMLLSTAQFACCITAAMYGAFMTQLSIDVQFIARKFFRAWLVLATTADIVITIVMAVKLYSARTGVRSTDRAINKLLYVTIPGGAITAVVTLGILAVQLKYTDTMNYQILIICLTKFYSNSVVVCLNLRASHVNGSGRHTMLSGFHTDDQVSSNRLPFDVKVDCNVEKYTSSSAMMGSSGFHSDPLSNCSDYGMVEESRKYPISIHTKPLNIGPYPGSSFIKEKSSFAAVTEVSCEGHPFQSRDNIAVEEIKYLSSIHSTLSTKASGGHDADDKQSSRVDHHEV